MSYIILDRDGVINHDSYDYIKNPAEWQAIPGSLEAIARLNTNGFKVIVVTNQSGIGRGYFSLEMLTAIHEKFKNELAVVGGHIEDIIFCPHHPDNGCLCRKPKPGMLLQAQKNYGFELKNTFFIGDTKSDVEAAREAACLPILVLTGKGQSSLLQYPYLSTVPHFINLASAVDYVLSKR